MNCLFLFDETNFDCDEDYEKYMEFEELLEIVLSNIQAKDLNFPLNFSFNFEMNEQKFQVEKANFIGAVGEVANLLNTITQVVYNEVQYNRQFKQTDVPSLIAGLVFSDRFGNNIRILTTQNSGTKEDRGYDAIINGRSGFHMDAVAMSKENVIYYRQRTGIYYRIDETGKSIALNQKIARGATTLNILKNLKAKRNLPENPPDSVLRIFRDFNNAIERALAGKGISFDGGLFDAGTSTQTLEFNAQNIQRLIDQKNQMQQSNQPAQNQLLPGLPNELAIPAAAALAYFLL